MKRYGLYIVAGAVEGVDPYSGAPIFLADLHPTTTYTLFDGNKVIDEIVEQGTRSNENTTKALLAKHHLSSSEVDVIGG